MSVCETTAPCCSLLTWLPSYLVNERNFSLKAMASYGALPYAATAVASLTAGWATDRAIGKGRSVDRTRKPAAVSGLVVAALLLPAAALAPLTPAMICLVIAFASNRRVHFQRLGHHADPGRQARRQQARGQDSRMPLEIWEVLQRRS
jgi:hypothetical protein